MNPIARVVRRFGVTPEYPYECKVCGKQFEIQYHVCPCCDGFSIESTRDDWSDATAPDEPGQGTEPGDSSNRAGRGQS